MGRVKQENHAATARRIAVVSVEIRSARLAKTATIVRAIADRVVGTVLVKRAKIANRARTIAGRVVAMARAIRGSRARIVRVTARVAAMASVRTARTATTALRIANPHVVTARVNAARAVGAVPMIAVVRAAIRPAAMGNVAATAARTLARVRTTAA